MTGHVQIPGNAQSPTNLKLPEIEVAEPAPETWQQIAGRYFDTVADREKARRAFEEARSALERLTKAADELERNLEGGPTGAWRVDDFNVVVVREHDDDDVDAKVVEVVSFE